MLVMLLPAVTLPVTLAANAQAQWDNTNAGTNTAALNTALSTWTGGFTPELPNQIGISGQIGGTINIPANTFVIITGWAGATDTVATEPIIINLGDGAMVSWRAVVTGSSNGSIVSIRCPAGSSGSFIMNWSGPDPSITNTGNGQALTIDGAIEATIQSAAKLTASSNVALASYGAQVTIRENSVITGTPAINASGTVII